MYIDNMQLIGELKIVSIFILIIGVLIDHRIDSLLRYVKYVALAAHIQSRSLYWFLTLNDEVFLLVLQIIIIFLCDNAT